MVELIERMLLSKLARQRRIQLVADRPRPINPPARWSAARTLTVIFPNDLAEPSRWELQCEGDALRLTIGRSKLLTLQNSLKELRTRDDYAIGPDIRITNKKSREIWDQQCIWFWH